MAQVFVIPGQPGDKIWAITNIFAILVNLYGLIVMIITLCHVANIQLAYQQERASAIKSEEMSDTISAMSTGDLQEDQDEMGEFCRVYRNRRSNILEGFSPNEQCLLFAMQNDARSLLQSIVKSDEQASLDSL